MFQKLKKFYGPLLILAVFIFSAIFYFVGLNQGVSQAQLQSSFLSSKDFSPESYKVFWQTWDLIKKNYVDQTAVNPAKAGLAAAQGLIQSLGDPYSELFSPQEAKNFNIDLNGNFSGVGIEIGYYQGVLAVISPIKGTPAAKAGLEPNDYILKIDNQDASNLSLDGAVSKIRGPAGTTVTLTIMRKGWDQPKDFKLIRENINVPAITSKFFQPDIGYIQISSFNQKTYSEFVSAYQSLVNQGARRFVLDLRNDPGGYLDTAIQLAQLYLPKGNVIVREWWGVKKQADVVYSDGPGSLAKTPTVILVNGGSASAAEIFSAALHDNLGVELIGQRTFGKGSVQQVFNIDNYMLKLTVAYWLTPNGVRLEGKGLNPDVVVKENQNSAESIFGNPDPTTDPVLAKGISIVEGLTPK
ncbi:MAG: S41 family peptidase [Patescibacteria group bacterium]|nr:S41 family peptidase [Patescibacteria group bacterium]MCL5257883.1 S41 family peptidase [Patescibacteria group bacterium]